MNELFAAVTIVGIVAVASVALVAIVFGRPLSVDVRRWWIRVRTRKQDVDSPTPPTKPSGNFEP